MTEVDFKPTTNW